MQSDALSTPETRAQLFCYSPELQAKVDLLKIIIFLAAAVDARQAGQNGREHSVSRRLLRDFDVARRGAVTPARP
jgi:hypothetical protein